MLIVVKNLRDTVGSKVFYSRGPTEIDNGDNRTPEDSTVEKSMLLGGVEKPEELLLSDRDDENEDVPEGTAYPLNSKWLIEGITHTMDHQESTTFHRRKTASGGQTYRDG